MHPAPTTQNAPTTTTTTTINNYNNNTCTHTASTHRPTTKTNTTTTTTTTHRTNQNDRSRHSHTDTHSLANARPTVRRTSTPGPWQRPPPAAVMRPPLRPTVALPAAAAARRAPPSLRAQSRAKRRAKPKPRPKTTPGIRTQTHTYMLLVQIGCPDGQRHRQHQHKSQFTLHFIYPPIHTMHILLLPFCLAYFRLIFVILLCVDLMFSCKMRLLQCVKIRRLRAK